MGGRRRSGWLEPLGKLAGSVGNTGCGWTRSHQKEEWELHRLGGPAARGGGGVETLTLLLEEPPAMTATSPVWAAGRRRLWVWGPGRPLLGPQRLERTWWPGQMGSSEPQQPPGLLALAVTAASKVWDRPSDSGAAVQAPRPLPQAVLFVSFKTKEVQKAMDEKRFEEAIQLRGR